MTTLIFGHSQPKITDQVFLTYIYNSMQKIRLFYQFFLEIQPILESCD